MRVDSDQKKEKEDEGVGWNGRTREERCGRARPKLWKEDVRSSRVGERHPRPQHSCGGCHGTSTTSQVARMNGHGHDIGQSGCKTLQVRYLC